MQIYRAYVCVMSDSLDSPNELRYWQQQRDRDTDAHDEENTGQLVQVHGLSRVRIIIYLNRQVKQSLAQNEFLATYIYDN